jgi:1-acyl-sn-glycerol-3-phosphate acyltransferase
MRAVFRRTLVRHPLLTLIVVIGVMNVAATVMLAVSLLTLFRFRRFYVEQILCGFSRLLLRMIGVRMIVHRDQPWPTTQTVYISNHTSTLDVFALLALGLPNTRYFLSGFLRAIVPLGVTGYLAGTFWTVPQYCRKERVRLFQRAARILRQTGESVFLSPEGMRVRTGDVGPFNKGAFHLAGDLGAPLLPLYLAVPLPESAHNEQADNSPASFTVKSNLMSYLSDLRPCLVQVYVDAPIDTRGWRLEDLEHNRHQVRQRFLALHEKWGPRQCASKMPE